LLLFHIFLKYFNKNCILLKYLSPDKTSGTYIEWSWDSSCLTSLNGCHIVDEMKLKSIEMWKSPVAWNS
jgi:hypothetical protein